MPYFVAQENKKNGARYLEQLRAHKTSVILALAGRRRGHAREILLTRYSLKLRRNMHMTFIGKSTL